jgi:DNA-binding beta-propeller fold protein YncE
VDGTAHGEREPTGPWNSQPRSLHRASATRFKVDKFDIKGEGGTGYVTVEPGTGRVFVSRATHVMVVDGATGRVLGDITNTPGVHGAGIATKAGHGFTTNGGDQTVTMFDLKTLAVIRQIEAGSGLDGITYDEPDNQIILTRHSRPIGTLTALDPQTGDIVATVELEDNSPEGAAADGKGHIFVNNEGKNTIQLIDVKTWKATASWPLAPCEGPTGIAYDAASFWAAAIPVPMSMSSSLAVTAAFTRSSSDRFAISRPCCCSPSS